MSDRITEEELERWRAMTKEQRMMERLEVAAQLIEAGGWKVIPPGQVDRIEHSSPDEEV